MTAGLARVTHTRAGTRAKTVVFHLFTEHFMRTLSVHAHAYSILYGVAKSTFWRKAKAETFSLSKNKFYTFQSILALFTASLVLVFFISINVLRNVQQDGKWGQQGDGVVGKNLNSTVPSVKVSSGIPDYLFSVSHHVKVKYQVSL